MKLFAKMLFVLLFSGSLWAQGFDNLSNSSVTNQFSDKPAQYILGSGDILLVNVNLWGHVQRPGIYSVPSSYTIIDLISSAGGPLNTARLSDVRIVRKDQEVIKVDIEKYLKTGDNSLLPVIQPGDTIIVSGSIQNYFLQIVGLFRDLAIIANVFVLAQRVK
ncbi:MAG: SLBB domain-containing protein [Calditrichae bacterium]|nr:SLBB domain-containing protein [Calditrichota bacterium]MCB9058882.1 SLBB domain-containing protein [Calditrichia bacterium]